MDNNDVPARKSPSRRTFLSASAATAVVAPIVSQADDGPCSSRPRPGLRAARGRSILTCARCSRQIDPNRIKTIITTLAGFGTRHTASSQTDPEPRYRRGHHVRHRSDECDRGHVGRPHDRSAADLHPAGDAATIPVPTSITNVIATLQGTATPQRFYVVTGHLDSRCTDVLDFTSDAPGADDDGSGVAVMLELARIFATRQFPGTIVFAAVDGEEQGCSARRSWPRRWRPQAMTSRACSATTSSAPARPGTAPSPTRTRCGCSWRASRPPRRPDQISTMQVGRRRERRAVPPARPVRPGLRPVRADRHEHPDHLAPRPVPARQRPPLVPGPGLSGGAIHRAAGELRPRAPQRRGDQRRAVRRPGGVRRLRLRRPGGEGQRRHVVGARHRAGHAEGHADPHHAAALPSPAPTSRRSPGPPTPSPTWPGTKW